MRVLFATDLFYQNVSGSANFIRSLAKGLDSDGHQIFLIAPSRQFKNTVVREGNITVYGIRSVVIPDIIYPSNFRIPLAGSTKIRKIIEKIKPDVINIQDHFMIGSKTAKEGKKLNIPVVGTNHFMPENFIHYLYPPGFAKKLVKKLAWEAFLRVYKQLDIITTPTKTAADLIKKLELKNPIIPISNGVDLKRFNPKNKGLYLKKRYKIKNFESVILFVGRLDKEKHTDVLVKAFSKIVPSVGAKLVIAGKGTEKSNLIKLAKKLGISKDVLFTGFISDKDLPFLYRMADIFVIASIAELQSIATMEAMASGLPVVATKVMALPELVEDGKNGYLFDDADFETLAHLILKMLKNPALRKKMAQNSLKIIKQHDINITVKKYAEIYKKLVSN